MASSSLEHRTVRPGSLGAYSYYRSDRRPDVPPRTAPFIAASRAKLVPRNVAVAIVLIIIVAAIPLLRSNGGTKNAAARASQSSQAQSNNSGAPAQKPAVAATTVSKPPDECAGHTDSKLVLVSISQRHLWACSAGKTVYNSPVVTGMSAHASTVTPTGTYHIYGKQTDLTLTGSDVTGSWSDPVSYWMPFLNNQYGTYGLHDATWRSNSAFGHISPASSDASHGCVELPLATAKWVYNWVAIGTPVTIEN